MVNNERKKLIYGFGINDADYNLRIIKKIEGKTFVLWTCPFYAKWRGMLKRCYSQSYKKERPTYSNAEVCEEWKYFSKFKAWMETQDWEGKQLDKDILVAGNKKYSPETCVFVTLQVNSFLTESDATRGDWPIGVHLDLKSLKFVAQCWSVETGKRKSLGKFKTPEEAHLAWLSYKLEQAKILAEKQTDQRIARALVARYENYLVT